MEVDGNMRHGGGLDLVDRQELKRKGTGSAVKVRYGNVSDQNDATRRDGVAGRKVELEFGTTLLIFGVDEIVRSFG